MLIRPTYDVIVYILRMMKQGLKALTLSSAQLSPALKVANQHEEKKLGLKDIPGNIFSCYNLQRQSYSVYFDLAV